MSPAAAARTDLSSLYTHKNSSNPVLPSLPNRPAPLIERAGYYPHLRWQDPDDSDEESHYGEDQDSQAKWKRRKRTPGRARKALGEFLGSLVVVAVPSGLFYALLIRNG